METHIIGQEGLINTFNSILKDPPHIHLTGLNGCGKTTLAKDFIRAYFKINNVVDLRGYIMELSSEKDRGMATVRTKLADFTKEVSIVKGIYRWVLIDDADTLPVMSQQALRRPMEQYSHLTRFLFITTKPTDLIAPLRSRCFHAVVAPLPLAIYGPQFIERMPDPPRFITPEIQQWIASAALGIPAEYIHFAHALSLLDYNPSLSHVRAICAAAPFEKVLPIINNINSQDDSKLLDDILSLWYDGYGFEDILENLYVTADLFMILVPPVHDKFLTILAKGWESQVKARVSLLDLLRLFFAPEISF